jgi:hypothetical protein
VINVLQKKEFVNIVRFFWDPPSFILYTRSSVTSAKLCLVVEAPSLTDERKKIMKLCSSVCPAEDEPPRDVHHSAGHHGVAVQVDPS